MLVSEVWDFVGFSLFFPIPAILLLFMLHIIIMHSWHNHYESANASTLLFTLLQINHFSFPAKHIVLSVSCCLSRHYLE
jgi:hypothetical protein